MDPTTKASGAARMAILYLTVGVLLMIWTGIWRFYMYRHPPQGEGPLYICYGFLFSGAALAVIGLVMGEVGRKARNADLPLQTPTNPSAPVQVPQQGQIVAVPAPTAQPVVPVAAPAQQPRR
jgi:hypothetical protein